jgi:hypothetical protein
MSHHPVEIMHQLHLLQAAKFNRKSDNPGFECQLQECHDVVLIAEN